MQRTYIGETLSDEAKWLWNKYYSLLAETRLGVHQETIMELIGDLENPRYAQISIAGIERRLKFPYTYRPKEF